MKEIVTPEDFCWLYACGCLEMRLQAKTLSHNNYKTALWYLANGRFPRAEEVRAWFPKPFSLLEKDGITCTLEQMQNFWRVDHFDPREESPVCPGQIKTIHETGEGPELVRAEGLSLVSPKCTLLVASNMHRYLLRSGELVLIHGFVVAERLSQ